MHAGEIAWEPAHTIVAQFDSAGWLHSCDTRESNMGDISALAAPIIRPVDLSLLVGTGFVFLEDYGGQEE